MKDANGKTFSTRMCNVIVIGKGNKSEISLPKDQGLALTNIEAKKVKEGGNVAIKKKSTKH